MIRSENRKAIQVFKLQTSIVMLPVVSKSLLVWSNDSTAKVSVRFGLKDFPRKVCFLDQDMCFTARILRRFRSLKDLIHFKSLLFRLKVYTRKVFLSIERFHSKSPRFRLKEFTQKCSFSLKRFRSKRLRFPYADTYDRNTKMQRDVSVAKRKRIQLDMGHMFLFSLCCSCNDSSEPVVAFLVEIPSLWGETWIRLITLDSVCEALNCYHSVISTEQCFPLVL